MILSTLARDMVLTQSNITSHEKEYIPYIMWFIVDTQKPSCNKKKQILSWIAEEMRVKGCDPPDPREGEQSELCTQTTHRALSAAKTHPQC